MLNISNETLQAINTPKKESEGQYLYKNGVATDLLIKNAIYSNIGTLHKSNMKKLELELVGEHNLQGEWFNYVRSLVTDVEYTIDYGLFRVIGSPEYIVDEDVTKITLYDKMINTHKEVHEDEFDLSFPTTIGLIFKKVLDICELETSTQTFEGFETVVDIDVWTNTTFTYRDVLDHIAQLLACQIQIRDDKVEVYYGDDIDITISENRSKTLEIGNKIDGFNILDVTQEPQHWNTPYPSDWHTIPIEDRKEYVVSNNPIMDSNRQLYSPILFEKIKTLSYMPFRADTFGWGIFDIGDKIKVKDLEGNIHDTIITSEIGNFKQMFLSEVVSSKIENVKDEYVLATDEEREGQLIYFLVDQANGKIEGLLNRVTEVEEENARLTLEFDRIETEVKNVHLGPIIPNSNGREGFTGWTGDGTTLYTQEMVDEGFIEGFTYGVVAQPKAIPGAMSEIGWEFFNNDGSMYSPAGYVARPGEQYAFRSRVDNFKPIEVTVLEYKGIPITTPIKETLYNLSTPQQYVAFEHVMQSDTTHSRLKLKVPTVSFNNRTSLSDIMFNIGYPKEWFDSVGDARAYAYSLRQQSASEIRDVVADSEQNKSEIQQLSNKIVLAVDSQGRLVQVTLGVDDETGSYVVLKADSISLEGLTTINGGFKILENGNMEGTNVDISGIINATGGTIGGYNILSDRLQGNAVVLGQQEIKLGQSTLRGATGGSLDNSYLQIMTPTGAGGIYIDNTRFVQKAGGGTVRVTTDFVSPEVNGSGNVGSANTRYARIFLTNQPDVSSDSRYKRNILPIDDKLIDIFGREVEPRTYTMRDEHNIHFGYIAQDVERALYKYTLSTHGLRSAKNVVSEFAVLSKSESYMSLLYGEIAVIMDAYNRRRMDKLEKRIEALEKGRLNVSNTKTRRRRIKNRRRPK